MTHASNPKPELLSPAGGSEALRAAVAGGADAVYLGLEEFNARRGAPNFTLGTIGDACKFAHLRGVRVYLTVNVVILPSEMQAAADMVDRAWAAGVDAVIVQDMGLLRVIRETMPHVRVHASTQINAHSSASVRVLAQRGVSRVTLARETSLQEIGAIARAASAVGIEVESFVHGAICVCYSGQCLLSSLIGGRSANRGTCAQPCRLPYELVDEKNKVTDAPGTHLLSPKDLAGLTVLDDLVATGVAAVKIEGRMKSAEYVALVTGVYRSALDRASDRERPFQVRDGELEVLNEAFSRGFTEAYLAGERGNDMMSYRRPNNRGVAVGRIATVSESGVTLTLDVALDSGDTVEVWTSRGRFAQTVGPLAHGGGVHRTAPAGSKPSITVSEPVSVGDRVFRVRNAALSEAAARTFADPAGSVSTPLTVSVRMTIGDPLEIMVSDDAGRTGRAEGPVVERARTRPVTSDDIAEHVGRLGGTAFSAKAWDIELSSEAGIGFSVLHRVRREAIADYESGVLKPWSARVETLPSLPYLPPPSRYRDPAPRLVASVSSLPTARACLQAGCESVYIPVEALLGHGDAPLPRGMVLSLPRIAHDAEIGALMQAVAGAPRVQAATLGLVSACAEKGIDVEAHWSLNALNSYAVAELADVGAGFVWLSPELSSRQVSEVVSACPVPVGVAVSGRQELMVTEHCILMSEGPCSQRCESCPRRQGWRFLRDRKGYSFPVKTDSSGRSHVYNSVPLDLTHALPELLATGVAALRLDLETEPANRAAAEVARVRQALQDTLAGREPVRVERDRVTSGHFFRGVSS